VNGETAVLVAQARSHSCFEQRALRPIELETRTGELEVQRDFRGRRHTHGDAAGTGADAGADLRGPGGREVRRV